MFDASESIIQFLIIYFGLNACQDNSYYYTDLFFDIYEDDEFLYKRF